MPFSPSMLKSMTTTSGCSDSATHSASSPSRAFSRHHDMFGPGQGCPKAGAKGGAVVGHHDSQRFFAHDVARGRCPVTRVPEATRASTTQAPPNSAARSAIDDSPTPCPFLDANPTPSSSITSLRPSWTRISTEHWLARECRETLSVVASRGAPRARCTCPDESGQVPVSSRPAMVGDLVGRRRGGPGHDGHRGEDQSFHKMSPFGSESWQCPRGSWARPPMEEWG